MSEEFRIQIPLSEADEDMIIQLPPATPSNSDSLKIQITFNEEELKPSEETKI